MNSICEYASSRLDQEDVASVRSASSRVATRCEGFPRRGSGDEAGTSCASISGATVCVECFSHAMKSGRAVFMRVVVAFQQADVQ